MLINMRLDSPVGKVAGYGLDDRDLTPGRGRDFFFPTTSIQALVPVPTPIQWVLGTLSVAVKRPKRETDHSFPPSTTVKNACSHVSTLPYITVTWWFID